MKKKIHPKYFNDAKVACACGNTFTTGSTQPELKVEICNACHPFFTGEEKFIDRLGRLERFKQKQTQAATKKYIKKSDRRKQKAHFEEARSKTTPKTLKDMLKTSKPKKAPKKKS